MRNGYIGLTICVLASKKYVLNTRTIYCFYYPVILTMLFVVTFFRVMKRHEILLCEPVRIHIKLVVLLAVFKKIAMLTTVYKSLHRSVDIPYELYAGRISHNCKCLWFHITLVMR